MASANLSLEPVKETRKAARHSIRQNLRAQISSGELKPGTKLRQEKLAKEYGVSMGVIREAILDLQACGLIETIDNRGMFVTRWSAERLMESFDIREVLEGMAARLCCKKMTPHHATELRELAKRIFALKSESPQEAASLDRQFHHRIIEIAEHALLGTLTDHYRFTGKVMWTDGSGNQTYKGHLGIIEAIQANHPEEAEQRAREHVLIGRRNIERAIADGSFHLDWVV